MTTPHYYDLSQRPPRSARVRLGGYVILARMLDKGRATLAAKNGDYKFDCPLDGYFLEFTGLTGEDVKKLLQQGSGDGDILTWIQANAPIKRRPEEIFLWSQFHETRAPSDVDGREFFHEMHKKYAPAREDIRSWFDLLDLDDHVSFGGLA